MEREAELAFKQAFLLSPHFTEAVWRYAIFLFSQHRAADFQKFVLVARKLNPDDQTIKSLARYAGQLAEDPTLGR
jgi:hypothetical protein